MEFSPYLRGIQQVPGKTPGEKFRSLNEFARKIANDASRGQGGPCTPEIHPTPDLPQVLIPLVRLEVAKILRQPEEIVAALKSGDSSLVARALTCKWFFNGSLRDYTNAAYFVSHIFPHLSLRNRAKVIRSLAKYLNRKDPTVAEEFYEVLSEKYGNKQAEPLLLACRDTFIRSTVETRRLTLSICTVQRLYLRHPQIILNYLKSVTTDAFNNRNFAENLMVGLRKFLPHIFKHFPTDFIEILVIHKENFDLKLNSKRTCHFFQQSEALEALVAHPRIFLSMLSRKIIAKKLTGDQFIAVINNLVPSTSDLFKFYFETMLEHIEYFPGKKVEEIFYPFLSHFKNFYRGSLFDFDPPFSPQIVRRVPRKILVHIARNEIAKVGQKFDSTNITCMWPCYLPISESISVIKNQLNVASTSSMRCDLLAALIYTYWINNDDEAFLEALKYTAAKHNNEQNLLGVISNCSKLFQVENLTPTHWNCVMDLITSQDGIIENFKKYDYYGVYEFLMKKIVFDVINHLPDADKDTSFFIKICVRHSSHEWPILEDQPLHLQKKCLELIINTASSMPDQIKNQTEGWLRLIATILESIYEFNKCIKHSTTSKDEKLDVIDPKNYSWLCQEIPAILADPNLSENWLVKEIKRILTEKDPELYEIWSGKEDKILLHDFPLVYALKLLKKDWKIILRNWQVCYNSCKKYINSPYTHHFIKSCRWYEDIPVKFVEKALRDLPDSEDGRELIILALLVERKKFEEIIEPFIPTNAALDVDDLDTKRKISINKSVMMALNVKNNLLSSEIYFKYFNEDYLPMAHYYLKNRCQRAKVKDVLGIAEKLIEIPGVSIKKHGIRLFFAVATLDQQMKMMAKLVDTEEHRTIRFMLCEIARNSFISQPGPTTFAMMCNCLKKMPLHNRDVLEKFMELNGITDQYIAEYFKIVLATIDNPDKDSDGREYCISLMIDRAERKIGCFFPEDYQEELLEKYFATSTSTKIVSSAIWYLLMNYIETAGEKQQLRLNYFSKILTRVLKKHWNNSYHQISPDCDYPVHWMFQCLTDIIVRPNFSKNLQTKLLKILSQIFHDTLKPEQAPQAYIRIQLASLELEDTSAQTAKKIASILPHLVDVFSLSLTSEIAQIIFDTLKTRHSSKNFNSYFFKTVKCLLKYDDQLLMHLCANWLMKGFFNDFPVDSILTIIQILDRSTSSTVIEALAIYRENN